jgi:hypothetical protein
VLVVVAMNARPGRSKTTTPPISIRSIRPPPRLGRRATVGTASTPTDDHVFRGKGCVVQRHVWPSFLLCTSLFVLWARSLIQSHTRLLQVDPTFMIHFNYALLSFQAHQAIPRPTKETISSKVLKGFSNRDSSKLERPSVVKDEVHAQRSPMDFMPPAFQKVYQRAVEKRNYCSGISSNSSRPSSSQAAVTTIVRGADGKDQEIAALPPFGIISALEEFPWPSGDSGERISHSETCELPPESHECNETMVTVVFMAFNEDRMKKFMNVTRTFVTGLGDGRWTSLIAQVILVWNGLDNINGTGPGDQLLQFASEYSTKFRVVYPLRMGFPNDLMNRYNLDVLTERGRLPILTKALLYFDHDGPFYEYPAVMSGFELWKRHPRAQMGAMSRKFNLLSQRQQQEQQRIDEAAGASSLARDQYFVSHCPTSDMLEYESHYFSNYDANMVLPSGSILHVNYLCFLWHPVFQPIRQFVLAHPAHPDDATVSAIVSQLAGQAPRVYSRRINPKKTHRKLREWSNEHQTSAAVHASGGDLSVGADEATDIHPITNVARSRQRKLLEGIHWNVRIGEAAKREYWLRIRTAAINSLAQYFGSVNSGSIGWCENTPYYSPNVPGKCSPTMAEYGDLPWLHNPELVPKSTCP